ncbi:hypothetical protein F2Q70_00015070 [Brassica cretica]|uniref:RNase H type-1 domain-containing protein n=1 Tax=Brassica cretica TaxID=69181 RepID=A0A8S9HZP3_BRACR|nr:hypothetical protein F2Q70_00015070 [Brassica cretica]
MQFGKEKDGDQLRAIVSRPKPTIQTELPQEASYYCLVDESWKSSRDLIGIGWSLYSKEGNRLLHGSSSLKTVNTVGEAEAAALLSAVQQLRRLNYKQVAFMADCKNMIEELNQLRTEQTLKMNRIKECAYTFHYVSRESPSHVDALAKQARVTHKNYVITWIF